MSKKLESVFGQSNIATQINMGKIGSIEDMKGVVEGLFVKCIMNQK